MSTSTRTHRARLLCWSAIIPLLSLTLAPQKGYAQGVDGTVRYQADGQGISGAFVSALGAGGERVRGVLTNAEGHFTIDLPAGRYRLRAERIGLGSETTAEFEVVAERLSIVIEMDVRPIEIEGLVVDARVRSCGLRSREADRIQRWWTDIRTALAVSAALQREEFGRFLVVRTERVWNADMSEVIASNREVSVSTSTRPFEAAPAEELVEQGFVQGRFGVDRFYYGPDADVLLSSAFLRQHCFSLAKEGRRKGQLGLHFEPVEGRDVSDIEGTLWIDTTTAELRDLDFRFVNVAGPEGDDAGGEIVFQYLPSGAWIVSEWGIRIPETGVRGRSRRVRTLGYHEGGGSVLPLAAPSPEAPTGDVNGVVVDSLRGGGLSDAVVTVLGTSHQTTTDENGVFRFPDLPAGRHYLSFMHADLEQWGIGRDYTPIDVRPGESASVRLHLGSFRQMALALCLAGGVEAETILVGHVRSSTGQPLPGQGLRLEFDGQGRASGRRVRLGLHTDEEGRFVSCGVPGGVEVTLRGLLDQEWVDLTTVTPQEGALSYTEIGVRR